MTQPHLLRSWFRFENKSCSKDDDMYFLTLVGVTLRRRLLQFPKHTKFTKVRFYESGMVYFYKFSQNSTNRDKLEEYAAEYKFVLSSFDQKLEYFGYFGLLWKETGIPFVSTPNGFSTKKATTTKTQLTNIPPGAVLTNIVFDLVKGKFSAELDGTRIKYRVRLSFKLRSGSITTAFLKQALDEGIISEDDYSDQIRRRKNFDYDVTI